MTDLRKPFTSARVVADNVDSEDYHRQTVKRGDPSFVMSRSELMNFAYCPSGWIEGAQGESTKETEWGQMVDCLLLQPHLWNAKFAVHPETYLAEPKKKGGEALQKKWTTKAVYCAEWEVNEEMKGKLVVSPADCKRAVDAVKAVESDIQSYTLIQCSRKSVLIVGEYHDRETDIKIPLKCLPDLVPIAEHKQFGRSLADLKTASCAHPGAWPRHVNEFDYHVQAAMCLDMYIAATGEDRVDFRHVIVESKPPYNRGRRILSSEFIELGRMKYLSALKLYAGCLASGKWPEFDDTASFFDGWGLTEPANWMVNA